MKFILTGAWNGDRLKIFAEQCQSEERQREKKGKRKTKKVRQRERQRQSETERDTEGEQRVRDRERLRPVGASRGTEPPMASIDIALLKPLSNSGNLGAVEGSRRRSGKWETIFVEMRLPRSLGKGCP